MSADRFTIARCLGSGGAGIVYEAYDQERQERVALKRLKHVDPAAIYRLKKEFRALADFAHPNFVSLYELFADDNEWFFTMELIEGETFLEHVRPRLHPGSPSHLDVERLRSCLSQLTSGIAALHAAGKVHRDLKPSNVLVTPAGRTVILDFGITRDLEPETFHHTVDGMAGTVNYMAPEQALGKAATPAADWYAIGVMLYEALTGTVPFEGDHAGVLQAKLLSDAPPPDSLHNDLPGDLARFCADLLVRPPEKRLMAAAVFRRAVSSTAAPTQTPVVPPHALIGREEYIARLDSACDEIAAGLPVTVYVHGPSGIGKSSLVEHFLDRVAATRAALVLSGRCYERESVPYKALDGIIDSLTRYLRTLSAGEIDGLLPPDAHAIATLFPVLRRVEAIEHAPRPIHEIPDPIEQRRRAVTALRELFGRLAAQRVLVLHVDDLHWTADDSLVLLDEILRDVAAPRLLFIASFRSEEIDDKPFLARLLSGTGTRTCRELRVERLSNAEARTMARSILGDVDDLVTATVTEADGNPFLVEQLGIHIRERRSRDAGVSLDQMLAGRIARLPPGAREMLEILAVARHPVDFELAFRASGVPGEPRAILAALRSARLVRAAVTPERIEPYHDRIAQAVVGQLDADRVREIHLRLSNVLAAHAAHDPEVLFAHYAAAGERERAAGYAARAAARSADALAFDQAARFFGFALEYGPPPGLDRGDLYAGMGNALANAGRPAEAAEAFLNAGAAYASKPLVLENRRRAAEQLLIGGHNDRGLLELASLMEAVGLPMPGHRRALLAWLVRRIQIRLRGLDHDAGRSAPTETELLRMDACWAAAIGLTMVDHIVAAYFQTRYLLFALGTGEPFRVVRALAFEAGFLASFGRRSERRSKRVLLEAQAMAEQLGSPRELGLAAVTAGSAACMLGDFPRAVSLCTHAETILRERCTGVLWELTTCSVFLLTALYYAGETGEIKRRVPALLAAAHDRGNLFDEVEIRTRQNVYWLITGQPEEARRKVAEALGRWSRSGFYRQNYNSLLALTQTDLYEGSGTDAWARLETQWSQVSRSLQLRVQLLRSECLHLRARCALAAAAQGNSVDARLKVAEQMAKRLEKERMAWSDPFVPLIRAGIAARRGNAPQAVSLLGRSAAGFDAVSMRLYAAVCRRRLGELSGGEEGRHLIEAADEFMCGQGIGDPPRITGMLAPGFHNAAT